MVAMFCDPLSSRYALGNVHFAPGRIEATDGKVLITVSCESNGMDGKLVAGKTYSKAMREAKYEMTICPGVCEPAITAIAHYKGRVATLPLGEGRFPRIGEVIDGAKEAVAKGAVTLCIASDVLSKIAKYVKLQANGDHARVTLYVTPDVGAGVLFYVHDSESVCVAEGVLMQITPTAEPPAV
jgi:hypothetical protein